jgi:hypothetical protein
MGRPRLFTADVLAAIPRWIAMGTDPVVIAEALGTTIDSLRVTCSQRGISLQVPGNLEGALRRELGEGVYERLEAEAAGRGYAVQDLVVALVEAAIEYDLVGGVLGDNDE